MNNLIQYQGIPGRTLTAKIYKNGVLANTISLPEVSGGFYVVEYPDPTAGYFWTQVFDGSNLVGVGELVIPELLYTVVKGVVSGTPTAYGFTCSTLSSINDLYNHATVTFTGCNNTELEGLTREVTDYTGATKLLEFNAPWGIVPDVNDEFSIIGIIA